MDPKVKTCSICKLDKPLQGYYKHPNYKDGYNSKCKKCHNALTKRWYVDNKDKEGIPCLTKEQKKLYRQEWRKNNPERVKEYYRKHRQKHFNNYIKWHLSSKYNCTLETYEQLLKEQNYKCKLCSAPHRPEIKYGRLFVDHDHKTGKIRGLLCRPCNHGLGLFRDDSLTLSKASEYIRLNENSSGS